MPQAKGLQPKITVFYADGSSSTFTEANTKGAFALLGMSGVGHTVIWTKFAAGVPGADSAIVDIIETALQLGFKGEFHE